MNTKKEVQNTDFSFNIKFKLLEKKTVFLSQKQVTVTTWTIK